MPSAENKSDISAGHNRAVIRGSALISALKIKKKSIYKLSTTNNGCKSLSHTGRKTKQAALYTQGNIGKLVLCERENLEVNKTV